MESNFEDLLALHRQSGNSLDKIMSLIASRMYKKPRLYGFRNEEDIGEVFSRYWARIQGMVERYQDNGASFDAYLVTTMRFLSISIYREQAQKHRVELTYIHDSCELSAYEPASVYPSAIRHRPSRKPELYSALKLMSFNDRLTPALSRHLSILCVKCAVLVSDDEVVGISRAIGVDTAGLMEKVWAMRVLVEKRLKRRDTRLQTRNAIWFRILLNRRILATEHDVEKRKHLERCISRDMERYRTAANDLRQIKLSASNQELAHMFRTTKTCVDSGQFRLKKRFAHLLDPRDCQGCPESSGR